METLFNCGNGGLEINQEFIDEQCFNSERSKKQKSQLFEVFQKSFAYNSSRYLNSNKLFVKPLLVSWGNQSGFFNE